MDGGLLVETLETAATWSALPTVYDAVRRALRESLTRDGRRAAGHERTSRTATRPAPRCTSRCWPTATTSCPSSSGCSAKRAATDALLGAGGTLTHHHAVGADHRPWLEREIGPLGVEVLRAVKQRLDPQGHLQPRRPAPRLSTADDQVT